MNPKLNSTVSVVKISESVLEFFKTNTRQQIHIRVEDDTIMNIVNALDGSKTIEELSMEYAVKKEITDVSERLQELIDTYNRTAPAYKRVYRLKVRDTEFPKTPSKKIKRY